MPQVTIAAIDGGCAGAALGWACACDFRFASERAKFATAFLKVGVSGDMGLVWSLLRLVGGHAPESSSCSRRRFLPTRPWQWGWSPAFRVGPTPRRSPHLGRDARRSSAFSSPDDEGQHPVGGADGHGGVHRGRIGPTSACGLQPIDAGRHRCFREGSCRSRPLGAVRRVRAGCSQLCGAGHEIEDHGPEGLQLRVIPGALEALLEDDGQLPAGEDEVVVEVVDLAAERSA